MPQYYCTYKPVYEQHVRTQCYTVCKQVVQEYQVPQYYSTCKPVYEQHVRNETEVCYRTVTEPRTMTYKGSARWSRCGPEMRTR